MPEKRTSGVMHEVRKFITPVWITFLAIVVVIEYVTISQAINLLFFKSTFWTDKYIVALGFLVSIAALAALGLQIYMPYMQMRQVDESRGDNERLIAAISRLEAAIERSSSSDG